MAGTSQMSSLDDLVWYVAFGSNLYRPRLLAYLQGTTIPGSPTGARENGARDSSPPSADNEHPLPFQLFFANHSTRWGGGGAAFVDPSTIEPASPTIGRRYLITQGQLEDVFRQENGATEVCEVDMDQLQTNGKLHGHDGWYDTLLYCGKHSDGVPMATITSSIRRPDNPPSSAYLEVISQGLGQLGYDSTRIAAYLDPHRGTC